MKVLEKLFKSKKNIKIEFCAKNLDRFLTKETFPLYQAFLSEKNIDYKEYECQSKCEVCKEQPYAFLNGGFVSGENANDLLNKLKEQAK